jgi:hypothetical protein
MNMAGRGFGNMEAFRPTVLQALSVATSATSVASSAFGAQTFRVRVATNVAAGVFYRLGDPAATPTATTSDIFLPASWVDIVHVTPGQKIAAISSAGTGTVTITEGI